MPLSPSGRCRRRKCPICAQNCLAPILPVREMPHLCTIFPGRQLPVQEMPLLCTEFHPLNCIPQFPVEEFPVREMLHLRTIFPRRQLPVQKNTPFDTELSGTQLSGAVNVPSVHHFSPEVTSGAEKHSF